MTKDESTVSKKMPLRWRLLFSLLFYGPAVYFKLEGDYISAAMCAVAGIAAFGGYKAGAVTIFTLFVAFAAAVAYAPSLGQSQELIVAEWFGTSFDHELVESEGTNATFRIAFGEAAPAGAAASASSADG